MPIKSHLLEMDPYTPPLEGRDSKKHTLLDFNERTVPTSSVIVDALTEYLASEKLQQYPFYGDVCRRLSSYAGVDEESVMITNGSDQGIDLVFRAYSFEKGEAIIPGPSFAMYHQCAKIEGLNLIEPQYDKETGYPVDEVINAITDSTALVVVSNPNNPCGTLLDNDSIIKIAKAAPNAAVLVDECYYEYSKQSVVDAIKQYPNIIVTRTFSKTWGIPSLRFGYLMADPKVVAALCNVRGPYDVNQMAVVAANAALKSPELVDEYVSEVMREAKPLLEAWLSSKDIDYWQSGANYIWTFPKDATALNTRLVDSGFLVRPKAHGADLGLRITVGTVGQTKKLISVWEQWLAV